MPQFLAEMTGTGVETTEILKKVKLDRVHLLNMVLLCTRTAPNC